MNRYTVIKTKRSYCPIRGYQLTEHLEDSVTDFDIAVAKIQALNANHDFHEVYHIKKMIKCDDVQEYDLEKKVLYGKRFKVVHPKLKPILYMYDDGFEVRDRRDTIHISDIECLLKATTSRDGTVCLDREMADIIKETIFDYNCRRNLAVTG